ncbi:TonB-dependent siderophore receptor [Hymenobacter bucti]|uniref:TonB-dependent siderophore receptor n=1 Tax=Hymenobacter bucti TaxID=1844114 RepID=A0ABW4R0A2_9BACT
MRQLVLPVFLAATALPVIAQAQAPAAQAAPSHAQRHHGTIRGIIRTSDGKPAAFVSVGLPKLGKGTTTAEDGSFTITGVEAGTHVLQVALVGVPPQRQTVTLAAGETATADFALTESSAQLKEVEVKGSNVINRPATASKSDIAPLDLPQSIGVVTSTVIADQQINRLGDALRNVSGVSLTQQRGGVAETFSARGYSIGIAGSGGSIFKNGLLANTQGFPDASTLESVEVLKGASALLYGNVSGGLIINTVTKKPRFERGGSVEMRAGSYGFYKPIVDLYGPITKNLAFRVVGTYEDSKSFRDVVRSKRLYVNPSLLYKFSDKTDLLVQGDYLRSDITPDAGIGIINQNQEARLPEGISRSNFINAKWAYNVTDQASASAVLNHRFSDQWRVNAIAGITDTRVRGLGVAVPNGTIAANGDWVRNLAAVRTSERDYNAQLNLNGKFETGPLTHQLLVGGDALRITTNTGAGFTYQQLDGTAVALAGGAYRYDVINIIDRAKYAERTDGIFYNTGMNTAASSYRFGGYAQDLITIVPMLKVLGGVRYSYQNVLQTNILNTQTGVETRGTAADKADRAWSPKGALIFQPLPTVSIYTSYANNFITNAGSVDVSGTPLAPSHVDQYEAGIKSELLHSGIFANAAVYRYRNSNFAQPVLVNGTTSNFRELTGETTSDGVDVDFSGSFSSNFYFNAGYAYNFMRYTNTSGVVGGQVEGERLINNPAHTANASIFYTFDRPGLRGLKVGASAFYTGQRLGGNNNTVGQAGNYSRLISLSGFTTLDLSAGYTYQRFSILAKVSNITNALNYLVHDRYSINPIPPRQFLTTVGYRF